MPVRAVNFSTRQTRFIDDSIRRFGFLNTSAVVRAALRLLQRLGVEAAVEPRAPDSARAKLPIAEAQVFISGMAQRWERRALLEERVSSVIDSLVQAGTYQFPIEAVADLMEYLETRLDMEQPAPNTLHLRLTETHLP